VNPTDLGLPPKFAEWRPRQLDAVISAACNERRFTIINAPPGCVSHDTVITVARGGRLKASKKYSIEREFTNQNNVLRRDYPTFTRSLLGDRIGLHEVSEVVYSGVKLTYELVLEDGRKLRATPDHEILTTEGFTPLVNLRKSSIVVCDGSIPYSGLRSPKRVYSTIQGLVFHPFAHSRISYRSGYDRRRGHKRGPERVRGKIEFHRVVAEARLNGLSVLDFVRICRTDPDLAKCLQFIDPDEFHVHHKDNNHLNNHPDNLDVLSCADHLRLHRPGDKLQVLPTEVRVKSVAKFKMERTYDLMCTDPHRNFLANGIVVHNCGKSTIYMAVAAMVGGRTLALTQTKGLQQQLMGDFSEMGLVEVKGQNNYPCLYFEEEGRRILPGCDEGPCHAGIECELREGGCNYYDALRRASKSRLVVTNYSYWMTMNRYAAVQQSLGKFDTLILDEAHDAAESLAEFVKIEIVAKEVKALLGLEVPRGVPIEEWVHWADTEALPVCRARVESAKTQVSMYRHSITVVRRLNELETNLAGLAGAKMWKRTDAPDPPAWVPGASTDWIIEENKDGATFQPVWASGYGEKYLFAGIPRVILVSATVTTKDAGYLGIDPSQYLYKEYPSPFKRSRRPIYTIPTVKVGRNMTLGEEKIWLNRIDQIVQKEAVEGGEGKGSKGIVFTMSYAQMKLIQSRSRFSSIIYVHDRRSMRDTVAAFKAARPPAVLVSPSVGTGWDFPQSEARFQIIAKMPFIDSRPAVIKARHKADKRYLDYVTIVELIQRSGRGMRSEDDFCRTYIIDDHWYWFFAKNKNLMPKWFRSSIRRVRSFTEVET